VPVAIFAEMTNLQQRKLRVEAERDGRINFDCS